MPLDLYRRWQDWRRSAWNTHVEPLILRCGWRRPHWVRLGDGDLQSLCGYDDEDVVKEAVKRVRGHTMTSFERLATLWQQVRYLDRYAIPGSFVECGTWRGGSVGMMALAHVHGGRPPSRSLHLFDSFEGLPEPRADVDGPEASVFAGGNANGRSQSIRQCVGSLEDNRTLLTEALGYPARLVHYHVGWFADVLPRDAGAVGPIALLRLDGDWYDSTRVCLERLYEAVVPGGIVIIDDYGHWPGCRQAVDEFLVQLREPVYLHHVDYSGRCWVRMAHQG